MRLKKIKMISLPVRVPHLFIQGVLSNRRQRRRHLSLLPDTSRKPDRPHGAEITQHKQGRDKKRDQKSQIPLTRLSSSTTQK